MDADSGIMRMLQEGEKAKVNEQLFEVGEYLSIKGCVFSIQDITPERIILKNGLVIQGWQVLGGNDDTFLILQKPGKTIKVFADNYDKPNHFIVRYSYNVKEESNAK